MPLDVTHMETPALDAAKADALRKANELMGEVRTKASEAGVDAYALLGNESETYTRLKAHLADVDLLEAEMGRRREAAETDNRLKAAFARMTDATDAGGSGPALYDHNSGAGSQQQVLTPGQAFVESDVYRRQHDRTKGFSIIEEPPDFCVVLREPTFVQAWRGRDRLKALLYSTGANVGAALVRPEYDMIAEMVARPTPDILSLVSVRRTNSDTVYWISQTARATSAATVAQATNSTGTFGTKPEGTITYARRSASVETIAELVPVTEQELADAENVRALIDQDLLDDLALALDNQILTGNGVSPNLTGILNAGVQAVVHSTASFANRLDTLLRAQVVIMTASEPDPEAYVLHPIDWETVRTTKADGTGEYLMGPAGGTGFATLWGKPMRVTSRITQGTALCGAFKRACVLYDRMQSQIRVGTTNDDFARNILRVRGELRATFLTRRPNAIAKVTGL